jgi:hypothetical protein
MNEDQDDAPLDTPTNEITSKRQKTSSSQLSNDEEGDQNDIILAPFPNGAANRAFRFSYSPNGVDPRGAVLKDGEKLSIFSCPACKCSFDLCHEKRFGLYCGLRVGELIEEKGIGAMRANKIKPLMKIAYNEVLRVETVQNIGVLDTHNNYDPPECMLERSMKNIMRHFYFLKFTESMKERLQDGSRGDYGSGKFGFYSILREQEKINDTKKEENDGENK